MLTQILSWKWLLNEQMLYLMLKHPEIRKLFQSAQDFVGFYFVSNWLVYKILKMLCFDIYINTLAANCPLISHVDAVHKSEQISTAHFLLHTPIFFKFKYYNNILHLES